jgi:hypothetical protein
MSDEDARRAASDAAAALSGATVGGLVGMAIHGPAGAAIGAPAGVALEHSAKALGRLYQAQRERNATRVLEEAAAASGGDVDGLAAKIAASEQRLSLAGQALSAGAETTMGDKIRALGRSLAMGVEDDARVDPELLMVAALRDLEPPQVKVLAAISSQPPMGNVVYENRLRAALTPEVEAVLMPVLATLTRHGLVEPERVNLAKMYRDAERQSNRTGQDLSSYMHVKMLGWLVTDFGRELLRRLQEA